MALAPLIFDLMLIKSFKQTIESDSISQLCPIVDLGRSNKIRIKPINRINLNYFKDKLKVIGFLTVFFVFQAFNDVRYLAARKIMDKSAIRLQICP
jgi:hypothetical protein